jgi:hypothetical protein
MQNLSDLLSVIRKAFTSNSFHLGQASFEPASVASVLKLATGERRLTLTNALEPKVVGDAIRISGRIEWWDMAAAAHADFSLVDNKIALKLTIEPEALNWTFTKTFPVLAQAISQSNLANDGADNSFVSLVKFKKPSFVICTHCFDDKEKGTQLFPGLNICAGVDLHGPLAILEGTTNKQDIYASGLIHIDHATVNSHAIPSHAQIYIPLGSLSLIGFEFSDAEAILELNTFESTNVLTGATFTNHEASVRLLGQSKIGSTEVDVELNLPDEPGGYTDVNVVLGDTVPSLDDLSKLGGEGALSGLPPSLPTGGISLTSLNLTFQGTSLDYIEFTVKAAPGSGNGWAFLPLISDKLRLNDIYLRCQIASPTKSDERRSRTFLGADFGLGGLNLLTGINLPSGDFEASLTDGNASVADVIGEFKPNSAIAPHLSVGHAWIAGNTDGSHFQFGIECAQEWSIHLGSSQIDISDVTVIVSKIKEQEGFDVILEGFLSLDSAKFRLSADVPSTGEDWTFEGQQSCGTVINLRTIAEALLSKLGVPVPPILPELSIHNLDIQLQLDKNKHLHSIAIKGQTESKGKFPIAMADFEVDTSVDIRIEKNAESGKYQFSGWMEADIPFAGDEVFSVSYEMGKDAHNLIGSWDGGADKGLGLTDVATMLKIPNGLTPPDGLDLTIHAATFEYHVERNEFLLSAMTSGGSTGFFAASKATGEWHFVLGVDFPVGGGHSGIPIIGDSLDTITGFLAIKELAFLAASGEIKSFTLPTLPALIPPAKGIGARAHFGSKEVAGATSQTSAIGSSKIDLKKDSFSAAIVSKPHNSDNPIVALAAGVIDADKLVFQFETDPSGFSVAAYLAGDANLANGSGGGLTLSDPKFVLIYNGTNLDVTMAGSLMLSLQDNSFVAKGGLSFDKEEMVGQFSIEAQDGDLLTVPAAQGVHFDSIGVEVGVVYEPPGLEFGLQGSFHIGPMPSQDKSKDDKFAFVLEMIEEVPNPRFFSFSMDLLSLNEALLAVTDDPSVKLPSPFDTISARDVSFYWSEDSLVLPDGTLTQPGVGFSGSFDLIGFHFHADLKAGPTGFSGNLMYDPIHLSSVVSITGNSKGLHKNQMKDTKTGEWIDVSNQQIVSGKSKSETRVVTVVKPGGPVVHASTSSSPYFYANWKVSLFGVISEEVDIIIDNSKAEFHVKMAIEHLLHAGFDCTLTKEGFAAKADIDVGLDEKIGPIEIAGIDFGSLHVVAKFDVAFALSVMGDAFKCTMSASFDFEGIVFHISEFHLTVPFDSIEDLPEILTKELIANMDTIFVELFENIGKLLLKGVEEVGKLVAKGAEEVAELAEEAGKEVAKVAEEAAHAVEKLAGDIGEDLEKAATALADFEEETVKEVAKVAEEAVEEVEKIGKEAEKVISEAAAEVAKVGVAVEHEVEEIGKEIGHVGEEVGKEVVQIAQVAAKFAEDTVKAAEHAAEAVLNEAEKVVDAIGHEAEKVWDAVSNAAKEVGNAIANAAKSVWNAISSY